MESRSEGKVMVAEAPNNAQVPGRTAEAAVRERDGQPRSSSLGRLGPDPRRQRFLIITEPPSAPEPFTVALNWPAGRKNWRKTAATRTWKHSPSNPLSFVFPHPDRVLAHRRIRVRAQR
jgi:hypothetical protein